MTNKPQKEHKPPLRDLQQPQDKGAGLAFLWLILICVILFFITPLPSLIYSQIPKKWIEQAIEPYYVRTPLYTQTHAYQDAQEIPIPAPLEVLGGQSGICFSFPLADKAEETDYISDKAYQKAQKYSPIAELIGVDQYKNEYTFSETIAHQSADDDGTIRRNICQYYGPKANRPREISKLYIRPITPFKALTTTWHSNNITED